MDARTYGRAATLERKREELAEIKRSRPLGPVTDKLVFDLQEEIAALEAELTDR